MQKRNVKYVQNISIIIYQQYNQNFLCIFMLNNMLYCNDNYTSY